jgi:RNA polymerase sigma factor (sigma-70 family)
MEDLNDLVAKAKGGSQGAFAVIYEILARPVAGYLRSRGVPDVEDVTSEVFLAVFAGIGRFQGDAEGFRSWVFTIAHRRCVDHWRRTGRRPATEPLEPDDAGTAPSAETAALENVGEERVRALLARLSSDQRDVLLLRIVGDLTVDQVAEVLGKTSGAVKALQHRGLAQLRKAVSGEGVTL